MPAHLKDTLADLIQPNNDWRMVLLSNWPTILGDLHKHVRLEKIQGDTLFLGVYEAVWMQELHLLSRMLIKTINTFLKADYVKDLRFKAVTRKKSLLVKTRKSVRMVNQDIRILPREQAALEKVTDEQLRSLLKEFLIRCYQERP